MISAAQMAVSATLGAFIGYFTNAVAIRSLFRPLTPRWYTLGWQGVIPRNRRKLADNISRVVGEDLLGKEYLAAQIQRSALQDSLRALIRGRVRAFLDLSAADLLDRLSADRRPEGVERWVRSIFRRLAAFTGTAEGREIRDRLLQAGEDYLRKLPVDELLRPEQLEGVAASLGAVLAAPRTRVELERVVGEQLDAFWARSTPVEELLPDELRELLTAQLHDLMPVVLERVAAWLAAPENVEHLSRRILTALEGYAAEGTGWSGVVGEIGLRLFGEQLRNAITERIPAVADEYLRSPQIRERVEQNLVESLHHLLQRPAGEMVGEHRQVVTRRIAWMAGAWLTSPQMQRRLTAALRRAYAEYADHTLEDLLPTAFWSGLRGRLDSLLEVSPRRGAAGSRRLSRWILAQAGASRTPLRRWLGVDLADEEAVTAFLCAQATAVLRTEVPLLVEQLDISHMVHEKIMGFDLLRVEGLVKSIIADQLQYVNGIDPEVTSNELRVISDLIRCQVHQI